MRYITKRMRDKDEEEVVINDWKFAAMVIDRSTMAPENYLKSTIFPRDCESFARRTFTTPKFRTFPTPKFGHFPPPKKNICQEDNCHPQFFSSFFGAFFLAFSTYSSWRTSRMGRRRCLMRWPWSTSSRRCVTRWSWSTSSRRWLLWWSWRTSRRRKGQLSFMFLFMAAWITHF